MTYQKSPAALRVNSAIDSAVDATVHGINSTANGITIVVGITLGLVAGAVDVGVIAAAGVAKAGVTGVDRGVYGAFRAVSVTRSTASSIADDLRYRWQLRAERRAAAKAAKLEAKATKVALDADPALTAFLNATPLPA